MVDINDPVSDFLAREQDALAELNENFNLNDQLAQDQLVENGFNLVNGGYQNGITLNGNDSGVDLSALDINDRNVFSIQNGRSTSPASVSSYLAHNTPVEKEEPEKIRKWRENQKQMIAEKDEAEEKKKAELREQAKKELQEWHAQRKIRMEKRKKENREHEAQYYESAEKNEKLNTWESISKLIESKSNRGTKDISRMKSLYALYADEPPATAAV